MDHDGETYDSKILRCCVCRGPIQKRLTGVLHLSDDKAAHVLETPKVLTSAFSESDQIIEVGDDDFCNVCAKAYVEAVGVILDGMKVNAKHL